MVAFWIAASDEFKVAIEVVLVDVANQQNGSATGFCVGASGRAKAARGFQMELNDDWVITYSESPRPGTTHLFRVRRQDCFTARSAL
jgi:hypothetical protein